ncbi:2-phosphosulfolactate phosphatase [Melghirimyces thermohalophilus]|uniref:Probable 2-phosphosulfolactate phosphatase n=1 Tax=Melghirimyces thermohalophilus TaxID=1236220 RepID=A0A1G6QA48_9BACL|nr:2-phosphosulfolactate phosphatase [Melghirimyces thermohalophilus]SDC88537.1 2-phosphosulfolactate phosphatase [Melghirimyces thermohalophilus]
MMASAFAHVDDLHTDYLTHRTVVVIDVFRSSSCIVTALANGARYILPVDTVSRARNLSLNKDVLTGGERYGKNLDGFDLGNSPAEYSSEKIGDKGIILTTTNGTRTLLKAERAPHVLVGCFLNATACAKAIAALHRDVVFLCAGTRGDFSLEDGVAAGCILDRLLQIDPSISCTDLAHVLLLSYRACRDTLMETLSGSQAGRRLAVRGRKADIANCLQIDQNPIVPRFEAGRIILDEID